MKHSLFLTILAAALLGSGVANAATTLYAKDYKGGTIMLGSFSDYGTLVVDVPLTMTGNWGYLDLYEGTTFVFAKENGADAICGIFTSAELDYRLDPIYFNGDGDVYNFTFDADAQAIVAASAGTPITLIQVLNTQGRGFNRNNTATLKLNGVESGNPVELGGVQFTYVGPQSSDYTFKAGEIGFTGYENGSYALKLVANGKPTPEPTTGTLSLLALAGLCARRRRK